MELRNGSHERGSLWNISRNSHFYIGVKNKPLFLALRTDLINLEMNLYLFLAHNAFNNNDKLGASFLEYIFVSEL